MKLLVFFLVALVSLGSVLSGIRAQPVITPVDPFRPKAGNSIDHVRVVSWNADRTEAVLTMEYSYDGQGGLSARILPIIEKKGEKGISSWFGADPVTVGRGQGPVSVKVRFFNDEKGVPAEYATDRLRILMLSGTGNAVLRDLPFLKKLQWGDKSAQWKQRLVELKEDALQKKAVAQEFKERTTAAERERQEAERLEKERLAKLEAERKRKEEDARLAAQALEAERREVEKRLAEERRLAAEKEKARVEAERKEKAELALLKEQKETAEREARAREEEKRQIRAAVDKAKAEADQKALAEAQKKEKERLEAFEKAIRETRAREEAARVLAAELAAKAKAAEDEKRARLEAQKREEDRLAEMREAEGKAVQKAREEAKAFEDQKRRLEADLARKALLAEQARKKEEQELKDHQRNSAEAEKLQRKAEAGGQVIPATSAPITRAIPTPLALDETARGLKTKITNVDVVNRSLDRTQMTIGVEFEYRDELGNKPMLGVQVAKMDDPAASGYFTSEPMDIGKSRRNFMLFPVRFQPPSAVGEAGYFSTDKVLVYLLDAATNKRFNLFPATMLLMWRAPNAAEPASAPDAGGNSLELEAFNQNGPHSGYITVKYQLTSGMGRLRARIFDSANPASAAWFESPPQEVKAGRGMRALEVNVKGNAPIPRPLFTADTIEIELLDANNKSLQRVTWKSPMRWAKPED